MQKFFVKTEQIYENKINIIGTDVNHILNVLRLKKDDKIQIGNEETFESYIVKIERYNKENVICNIIEKLEGTSESNIQIDLYQGLPKADKMEWIIQKTTEIGICDIIAVETKRTIVKLNEKEATKKIERWQKIAEVAAKQSKRNKIPQIKKIINVKQVCEIIKNYDIFLVAYEEEKNQTLKSVLKNYINNDKNNVLKVGIFIGPEGGIDKEEIDILENNNAKIISLGNRILRTETAPIVMSSNILYELEKND